MAKAGGLPWGMRTPLRKRGLTFHEMSTLLDVAATEEIPRIGLAILVNASSLLAKWIVEGSPKGTGKYLASHRFSRNRRKLARVPDSTSYPPAQNPEEVTSRLRLEDSFFATNDAMHDGARGDIGYAPFLEMPRHASPQAPRGIYGPSVRRLGRHRGEIFRASFEGRRLVA